MSGSGTDEVVKGQDGWTSWAFQRQGGDARDLAGKLLLSSGSAGNPGHHNTQTDPKTGQPLAEAPWLSWSRSDGAALAALRETNAIGCDVERLRSIDALSMAKTIGTEAELTLLSGLSEPLMLRAFFRLWTTKEAVLKAMGTGFRFDARQVDVPEALLLAHAPSATLLVNGINWTVRSWVLADCQLAMAWKTHP